MKLANHIRETIQSRELVKKSTGENLGKVTMSFGITQFVLGDTPQTMIERADKALYRAKEEGRNRVIKSDGDSAEEERISA